ncbi:MAG TPA: hypothetical protein VHD81_00605 [Mycobacteriales bacterium]|nr:hypothetical protein [Mycobacteriales bacterium]
MPSDDLLIPEGSLLLHIGPFKTGTTAIQTGFRNAIPVLKEHGVTLVGQNRRNVRRAVLSVTGNRGLSGDEPPSEALWKNLLADIHRADTPRAVLSSEFLCDAGKSAATEIVNQIGQGRVHVVVTVRPLAKILPSAWQQYVRNMLTTPYDEWLDAMFNRAPYREPTPSFWRRHRHGKLVAKWASIVGPENVSVVVADERDRDGMIHAFEDLLGLPKATLIPSPDRTNRSLTAAEIELIRQLNLQFQEYGWNEEVYHKFVRNGVVWRLLRRMPAPDEQRIITPQWALERAAAAGAKAVHNIQHRGVRVIGDPEVLTQIDDAPAGSSRPAELPVDAGVGSIVALLYRAGLVESPQDLAADNEEDGPGIATAAERAARRTVRKFRRWRSRRRALAVAEAKAGRVVPKD